MTCLVPTVPSEQLWLAYAATFQSQVKNIILTSGPLNLLNSKHIDTKHYHSELSSLPAVLFILLEGLGLSCTFWRCLRFIMRCLPPLKCNGSARKIRLKSLLIPILLIIGSVQQSNKTGADQFYPAIQSHAAYLFPCLLMHH